MKNVLTIQNLCQTLTIQTHSHFSFIEWTEALESCMKHGNEFIQVNRFASFAPIRHNLKASFFVDGKDYFSEIADALLEATEEIFIASWWLSPEIYMKRGLDFDDNLRLDRILKAKAEQGVKIFILLYKEFQLALGLNSFYTKKTLMSPNIRIMRHPDRITSEMTEFLYAHHEKLVVIDQNLAFVGGLDLCYGRWDNQDHMLTDQIDSVDKPLPIAPQPTTSSNPANDIRKCYIEAGRRPDSA